MGATYTVNVHTTTQRIQECTLEISHTYVHDIVRVRIVGEPVIKQCKLGIVEDNRVRLTERKEPANQSPARNDVRRKHLIGRMNDTTNETNQLRNLVKTFRSREILHGKKTYWIHV